MEAESNSSGILGFFSKALDVATPFAQRWAYGEDNATELALAESRLRYNRLNGSGANNENLALKAPMSFTDFLLGKGSSSSFSPVVLILGALVVGLIIWRLFVKR